MNKYEVTYYTKRLCGDIRDFKNRIWVYQFSCLSSSCFNLTVNEITKEMEVVFIEKISDFESGIKHQRGNAQGFVGVNQNI